MMNYYTMDDSITRRLREVENGKFDATPQHYTDVTESKDLPTFSCQADLVNSDLWKEFHKIGTEMIITKNGRCMFPVIDVCLHGLDDDAQYSVSLEMQQLDGGRWCRSKGAWLSTTQTRFTFPSPAEVSPRVMHPLSPSPSSMWGRSFKFNNIKLTNNRYDIAGNVMLKSMHKYIPVLRVYRLGPNPAERYFTFPETEFIAVTAYQNHDIAKLKIDNNPYARGFREGERRQSKKIKHQERIPSPDSDTPPPQMMPIDCSSPRMSSDSSSNSSSPPPDTTSSPSTQYKNQYVNSGYINPLTMGTPGYFHHLMAEWTRNLLYKNISNNYSDMYASPFFYPPAPQWRPVPTWHTPTPQVIRNENRPKGSSFTIQALLQ